MPEYPEIYARAQEMKTSLVGKTIQAMEVLQPKSLNIPPEDFSQSLSGARIVGVSQRGKWIFIETTRAWLLLNLGMGGEILLVTPETLPEKYRLRFDFDDGSSMVINFWWFGYAHCVALDGLDQHEPTAKLGPNVLELSHEDWFRILDGQRKAVKSFLLDQTNVAGIGNAYIHDILFLARLHPQRKLNTLSSADVDALIQAVHNGLQPAVDKGGAFYEVNLYGEKGGFMMEDILIGYREGQPCPQCGTKIEKIKTGSTSSFICPNCQPLE